MIQHAIVDHKDRVFPLRIEQHPEDGWLFIACDGIPGLQVFGPDFDTLLEQIVLAGVDLLKKRNTPVKSLRVELMPDEPTNTRASWTPARKFMLRAA